MAPNLEEVEIGQVYVDVGDSVKKGDVLFEAITFKASFDVEAQSEGTILSLTCKTGDTINVLETIGYFGEKGEKVPEETLQKPTLQMKSTPGARKLARENNLDLEKLFPDYEGIVKEEDLKKFLKPKGNFSQEEMTLTKKEEIKHLSANKEYLISSVTIALSQDRVQENISNLSEKNNLRLTLGEFVSWKAANLLKRYPLLNAFRENNTINKYGDINLGIAVKVEDDLLVPVIRKASEQSLGSFSSKAKENIMKAIRKKLSIDDMKDVTFTVSDLSESGVTQFQPMINENNSAILGIAAPYDSIKKTDGGLEYEKKLNLILVFDHALCDGNYGAQFLGDLKKELED